MSRRTASRVIVLVGGTSGIGRAAARQLAANGHRLIIVGRDASRGRSLLAEINHPGRTQASFIRGDVSTRDGVETVADDIARHTDVVDTLINNAGVMVSGRKVTSEGIELNFAVHHLAPYSMTQHLLPLLGRGDGRVVNTNSEGHRAALFYPGVIDIDFTDLQSERRYHTFVAYSRTKLANLLFTYEFHSRFPRYPIVAVHPGMARTRLVRSVRNPAFRLLSMTTRMMLASPAQGARPLALLATAPSVHSGAYYERQAPARSSPQSYSKDSARRLWEITEGLRGPMVTAPTAGQC